ncbi:DUF4962 domain-containing protein [Uliginosibacterium sp. H1]|uniref:DUF4962 domain-containing protein n=1 Tax=Uliginosibacterium sp. H1 TaxID=3114757 RepID=UPI002E18A6CE|nr:heparinase II/III family protein [Uliginosibacterium sp. H1]
MSAPQDGGPGAGVYPLVLDEPVEGSLTLRYQPAHDAVVEENPPRFAWLPELDADACYVLRVTPLVQGGSAAAAGTRGEMPGQTPHGTSGKTSSGETSSGETSTSETRFAGITRNFFTPDTALAPGRYRWAYAVQASEHEGSAPPASAWSAEREFEVPAGLAPTPAMRRDERWAAASASAHPRIWLDAQRLAALRTAVKADPGIHGWDRFMQQAVAPWADRAPVDEPPPYPGHKRDVAAWRASYIACQEALYAIRHLAVAGAVADPALREQARIHLLATARWDARGTTSREYNDEASFRVASALAWGYDWLHDLLSEDERAEVRGVLVQRATEVATHVIDRARIHVFPYDSHAVRAIGSVLVPAGIALLGEEPAAQTWLDYAVDCLDGLYPPWGGAQGGWAEGPGYWTTAMAVFLDAAGLLRNFCGHDLFRRPFVQNTGDFILYCRAPDTRRSAFCDESTLGNLPSLKVAYNMRVLAGVTGRGEYQWYFDTVLAAQTGPSREFYDYGWWDFDFDELVCRHDYPAVTATPPAEDTQLKVFRDIGWVAVQNHLAEPARHLQLLAKCSDYGSISHSHGDQGSFTLMAFGEELAFHSGHYVSHGSSMHRDWRRQTRSRNAILINGKGQYAGDDKVLCKRAGGDLLGVERSDEAIVIRMDATRAYRFTAPELQRWQRDIHFVHDRYLVIVDEVSLAQPGTVEWLLHTRGMPRTASQSFRHEGVAAGLTGEFVYCSSGPLRLASREGFAGVNEAELAGLERHAHLSATTAMAAHHRIVTVLVPYRIGKRERVLHFIDDQGFSSNFYFQDAGDRLYRLSLDKRF